MFAWSKARRAAKSSAANRKSSRTRKSQTALRIEPLEAREMMTVNYYGGALLKHVEVQAVYLGPDWTSTAGHQVAGNTEQYLKTMVNSPYMDMLTKAGYGVGRGTFDPGRIDAVNINKNNWLTDSNIRQQIQALVSNGSLKTPDANRLFVVYVEPGVAILNDHDGNATSTKDFLGYHGAFAGKDNKGHAADIHYAVIAYPGGWNPTSQSQGLPSNFAQLTAVTSHELSEAVTDPNVNYKTLGWYDQQRGEIGDIVEGQYFNFDGYIVQKESNRFDQAMTASSTGSASIVASANVSSPAAVGAKSTVAQHGLISQYDTESVTSHVQPSTGNHAPEIHHNLFAKSIRGALPTDVVDFLFGLNGEVA